jgi:hypothetical protein
MTHKIKFATIALRISTGLYVLVGLSLFALSFMGNQNKLFYTILAVFALAFAVGVEFVRSGIIQRKFWAWVAGLCIFGLYMPSIFLPLGALGLWGLLEKGTREEFGIGATPSQD